MTAAAEQSRAAVIGFLKNQWIHASEQKLKVKKVKEA